MVVGPEAAGSLLLGNVVRSSVDKGAGYDDDTVLQARIAGVVTGMAGAIIFLAGIARLGFLDSVLSRPFLRGFISAIGFVIFVDQLVPEMGLVEIQKKLKLDHSSTVEKIFFLFRNAGQAHALTCWVSFGAFAIIMICRFVFLVLFSPCFSNICAPSIFFLDFSTALFDNSLHTLRHPTPN